MIQHINNEKQNKLENLNIQPLLQQNVNSQQNVPNGILQQDPIRKNKEKFLDPLKMREQLCKDYDKAVNDYGKVQDKKKNEGSVPKKEVIVGITLEQATEYLAVFPELDVSKDDVLVENYAVIMNARKMVNRMKSIPELIGGNLIDPEIKEKFRKVQLITEYAEARFSCMENDLFGKLSQEDLEFIENAPDLDTVLSKKIQGVNDSASKKDLEDLFKNLKKSKSLLEQVNGEDQKEQDQIDQIENNVEGDLNKAFKLEEESDDEDSDDEELFRDRRRVSSVNEQQQDNNIALNVQEPVLQEEQGNAYEEQRLENDRTYIAQNFAYSTLLSNTRKGNKEDGAEMKVVKNALRQLQNAAIFEQKTPVELGQIYARLIPALEEYVRTHDVFYKAVRSEGAVRLTLVKDALYRARLEQRQLWALYSQRENEDAGNQNLVLKEEGDSRIIFAKMTRGIDALLAVEKGFTGTFINNKNKKLYKKDRIDALSRLFYQADRLAGAEREKYALLSGSDGIAGHMLRSLVDADMLKTFYVEKDKLIMKLSSKYNEYKRHPVPVEFLKNKQADPWDESVREQYALLRLMHHDSYRQLVGFEKMEDCLKYDSDQKYNDQAINRMEIKKIAASHGTSAAINSVLSRHYRTRRNSFMNDELKIVGEGEDLFAKLNKLTGPEEGNMASKFTELDPAQVYLARFNETNEVKKTMKIYGLTDKQTGEESADRLHAEFIALNQQYADVQQHDVSVGKEFEKEYKIKKGAERTDRRFAESGIAPESTMKKRSLLTGYMANILNMGELVSQDEYEEKMEGDKPVLGIYKQAPLGEFMYDLTGYKMKSGLNAQMAKLVFLNIICGQMSLDPTMLSAKTGTLSNGSNSYTIEKIRLDKYTEYSFGKLSGEKLLNKYKNGKYAKLLDKLDDATKEAIMNLSPILLEQYFGAYLSEEEVEALKDRVSTVQRYLNAPKAQENRENNNDTYEPKREIIAEYEELTYEKVKDYLALPENEKAKRRAENLASYNSHDPISLTYSRNLTDRLMARLGKETGLAKDKLMDIFTKQIKCGDLKVTELLNGLRMVNNINMLLNQDGKSEEDFYLIMKGLYSEYLSEYTHQNREDAKADFALAIDKVKDIMFERFGRFVEKYGELAALLNVEDFTMIVDGAELRCLMALLQDLNQMTDEIVGGTLFDKNDPRDAKLILMQDYANQFILIHSMYSHLGIDHHQNQNIKVQAFKEADENRDNNYDVPDSEVEVLKNAFKGMAKAARKLGMGPALSKEEYDSYIAGCEKRFAQRPLARAFLKAQKEDLKDHVFVKKEKKAPEDDSTYIAQVEELRKQDNTTVSVEALKIRDKQLGRFYDIKREENEFMAEYNIEHSDYIGAFDPRSVRIFLESYEKNENGEPKDETARKIHEQNRDFLTALFSGDRERMRPHLDRVLAKMLTYDITIEHLKDRNWILKHPEIIDISVSMGYLGDCMEKNEEYAWYFDELAPEVRALFIAKMNFITNLSTTAFCYAISPSIGMSVEGGAYKLYKGSDARDNCKTEEEAQREYEEVLAGVMENAREAGELYYYTDYELIKHRPDSEEGKDAIKKLNELHLRKRPGPIQHKVNGLNAFYAKYKIPKKNQEFKSDSVIKLLDRTIAQKQTKEKTGEILESKWKDLAAEGHVVVNKANIESIKKTIGNAPDRYKERLRFLREGEKNSNLFKDLHVKLPTNIPHIGENESEGFYSLFLSNLLFMNEDAATDNLVFIITNYHGDESSRKIALDAITQTMLTIAGDKSVFDEKKLQGSWGTAMENMSNGYRAMLKNNKGYVDYLKSKTDPASGKSYFSKVCDAMNIIRACGAYAKLYNTLKKDPIFASSDGGFLSMPASEMDTYEIRRAKSAMVKLDELGEQIKKGEYKKIDIDQYDLLEQEEKDIRDYCSKFSEAKGNGVAACQDIRNGLSEKIGNIKDDKKVLELTKLLSSLDIMEQEFGWHKDDELQQKIIDIAKKEPEKTEQEVRRLMKTLSDKLNKEHKRFLNAEVPEFLIDPEHKPMPEKEENKYKKKQKKSAALLMLTTTAAYRQMRGLDKLCRLLEIEDNDQQMELYEEAKNSSELEEYEGLSEAGIFEARDMANRVMRRVSKAYLTKHTSAENAGYEERTPILREEYERWIRELPGQEEKARKAKKKPLDSKVLEEINKILPQLKKDYSNKITADSAAIIEKMKSDMNLQDKVHSGFFAKWIKGQKAEYGVDGRCYSFFRTSLDGGALEVLLSEEEKTREYYADQFVRLIMSLEVSLDNLNTDWLVAHYDNIVLAFQSGTLLQNMMEAVPEYFKSMPKALFDIFEAKCQMLGDFTGALAALMLNQDIGLNDNQYKLAADFSENTLDNEATNQGIILSKREYDKGRLRMLWLCRNYNMENSEGENKYSNLRKEISSYISTVKPLTMESFSKPVQAPQASEIPKATRDRYKLSINKGVERHKELKLKAQELIPENVREMLTLAESDCLCAMYPLILDRFDTGIKEVKAFAVKEFEKLCLRMAGMEGGAPSQEQAAEQKKAALDTMAEYIMLYSIHDPEFVAKDNKIVENAEHIETVTAAVKSFKTLMESESNRDWKEDKKNKLTASGKTEAELLDQQISVIEAVRDQYMARKTVITG